MAERDYHHRFHAGNVGDVWKHCALLACLRAHSPATALHAIETHAGTGRYKLGPTGEWTAGLGRLTHLDMGRDPLVDHYLTTLRAVGVWRERPLVYPGSPLLIRHHLTDNSTLTAFELIDDTFARLHQSLGDDPLVDLHHGDGLQGALQHLHPDDPRPCLVHIDPSYLEKSEWQQVTDTVIELLQRQPRACILVWYPIKSLTRPNALRNRLQAATPTGTTLDLITTPIERKRNRLNGSGVALLNAPDGTVAALSHAAATLGPACATRGGQWALHVHHWREETS